MTGTGIFPLRLEDLPIFESDSEDERTPVSPIGKKQNNGNFSGTVNERGTHSISGVIFPKRLSELPRLETDSEEEDPESSIDLNRAILDKSFIETPGKNTSENENERKGGEFDASLDRLDNLTSHQPRGDDGEKFSTYKNTTSNESLSCSMLSENGLKRIPLSPIMENASKSLEDGNVKSSHFLHERKSLKEAEGIPKNVNNDVLENEENIVAPKNCPVVANESYELFKTPYKPDELQFQTPQVRTFQIPTVARTSRLGSFSSGTQKSRDAIKNEFKSTKVLFRTPITVSRPPAATLTNDSISLSLDDSILKEGIKSAPVESKKPICKSLDYVKTDNCESQTNPNNRNLMINGKEYMIIKKLGSGGSSSVFLGRRINNETEVALKVVNLQGETSIVDGYLNETKLLARLQGNVNIVSLFEYEHRPKESILYMVMEKGDSDLHKILQSYKTDLPLYALMNFWHQILQAVNYIHENGVIHSDLKPANFLMVNGRLKLIDFGIASSIAIDSTSIIKFSQAGTFNYVSPEALIDTSTGNSPMRGNKPKIKISTKSDIWSLGCILYLFLYKKTPFGHIKNIYNKINAISSPTTKIEFFPLPDYYPTMLLKMVQKCLVYNPKARPSVYDLLKFPFNMVIPIKDGCKDGISDC